MNDDTRIQKESARINIDRRLCSSPLVKWRDCLITMSLTFYSSLSSTKENLLSINNTLVLILGLIALSPWQFLTLRRKLSFAYIH